MQPLCSMTPILPRSHGPTPTNLRSHAHLLLIIICLLLSACCLLPSAFGQATDRQTKLILPKMVPDAKPELAPQTGHSDRVNSVAFSPDGKKLASGSSDNTVILWDVATGQAEKTLKGHTNHVSSVAYSPDGKKLASGSWDHTVILWDLPTGQAEKTLKGHADPVESVTYSPDGKKLASGSWDHTVILWDLTTGQAEKTLKGHTSYVNSVAFSPDGKKLASGSRDNTVILWDLTTGQVEMTLKGHSGPGNSVAFSPDGKELASESKDNTVILWDLTTGQAEKTLKGHTSGVLSLAFSPDGNKLASGSEDRSILWDLTTGQAEETLKKGDSKRVESVAFSPDGKKQASGYGNNTVILWDLTTGKADKTFEGHANRVNSVAFSPDGKKLASGGWKTVILWDLTMGQAEKTLKGHTYSVDSVAFSPDGKKLASGGGLDDTVILWDLTTGQAEKTLKGHAGAINSVAFSPDGKKLASGSHSGRVILWDLTTGQAEKTFIEDTGYEVPLPVESVAFSPDGKKLASGSDFDTVTLWNLATGQVEKTLKGQRYKRSVCSVAFSPDGQKMASGSTRNTVILWDLATAQAEMALKGHTGDWVNSVAFSPDGNTLVSGSDDNTVILWDMATGQAEKILRGHTNQVNSVAFSPDGRRLVSGANDGCMKVWDVEDGRERATLFSLEGGAGWLVTTPEGYYDCSLEASNLVSWRLGDHIFPFDQFSEKYYRPDIVRKALAGEDISNAPPLDGTQIPPNLVFASPAYGAEVTGQNVEVAMETAGVHPIKRVEMTVNGRRVSAEVEGGLEIEKSTENQRTFRVTVPLPPNEPSIRLRAVAYDTELLKSQPAELFLRCSGVQRQPGKLFIISIGVSKYKNTSWNLGYPDADAIAVADTFEKSLSTYFRSVEKRVLVNDQATISNVKFALRELKDNCTEEDAVILFIAGHGCMDEQGNYHSIVHDSSESDLPNTTLSWNDLGSLLGEVRAQALVMFADTCHAGSAIGRYEYERAIGRLNQKAGAAVFSASRGDEASIEREDWGHGAFTKALLEAIGGAADKDPADKRITTHELKDYLSVRVPELTKDQQHPYVPRLDEFPPDTFICSLPGYEPAAIQPVKLESVVQATPLPPADRQKPRSILRPAPQDYALVLRERVQFECREKLIEPALISLLSPRGIPFRLGQNELKMTRVSLPTMTATLEEILTKLLEFLGANARWEGKTLVIEKAQ